jgi:HSP20 family protein
MALVVNPQPFTRDVDRLFDAFFGGERESRRWVPPMDLVEAEDHFVLIEIQDGTLTISGERKTEHKSRERGWYRIERSFGSFSRSLTLPDGVDAEGIAAHFDRGVLEVRIPKPEERKPRRVEIRAGTTENGDAPAVEGSATETK